MTLGDDNASSAQVIAVVGPTASGKSDLAEALAQTFDSEIISADSMQVYRGMDIGTAKIPAEKRSVAYHCIDMVDPDESFSVARYFEEATSHITRLLSQDRCPILCGGTGLYIRAVLDSSFSFRNTENNVAMRNHYEKLAREKGSDALYGLLRDRDPRSAELMHPNNTRRVIRALEMLEEGTTYWQQHVGFTERELRYPTTMIALSYPREVLYERCCARVDRMIEDGLLEEVSRLLKQGFHRTLTAHQAIGYKELVDVVEGTKPLEEAIEEIKQGTRRYAKRQLTWFRADPRITWIDAQTDEGKPKPLGVLAAESISLIRLGEG